MDAAPWVVFGVGGEASFDWVAVDVAELFDALGFGADVEVVVARKPERGAVAEELGGLLLEDLKGGDEGVMEGSERRRWTCSGMRT